MNFDHLNINQLTENIINNKNIEDKIFFTNTFLTNPNNLMLKNSYENLTLQNSNIKIININII